MNRFLKLLLFAVIALNIFFSMWYVLHNDIFFHTDIARDFLLLDDLAKRKLVLIGPRSSGPTGFYHGPAWMYLNYPAYLLGNGNPVAVGWFWVLLNIAFLAASYAVAKKLFNAKTALIFVALLSLFPSIPDTVKSWFNGYYNPFGAMFLMPFYFYSIVSYGRSMKAKWLVFALLLNGFMFQFQVAFGGPLLILTSLYAFFLIFRKRTFSHLLSYLVLLVPFSTYIVFDLRHDFSHVRAAINLFNNPYKETIPFIEIVKQRLGMMNMTGMHLFREPHDVFGIIYAYAIAFGIYLALKSKAVKEKLPFKMALYLYVGYFVLSCFHNGWLMYYYWMPIFPVVFLMFAAIEPALPKKLYYSLFAFALVWNIGMSFNYLKQSDSFIGKNYESWKFQSAMVETIFKDAGSREFGFFIYTPDIFAYSTKYPFVYHQRTRPDAKMAIYERKPLTYLVIAPPPAEKPWLTGDWWKSNKIGIKKTPDRIWQFDNGYRVEKFTLNEKDLARPMDQNLNDWIYFR